MQPGLAELLNDGEWLVGEWLALAHSTRYQLSHEPLVVFDGFSQGQQWSLDQLSERLRGAAPQPTLLHRGGALSIAAMLERLGAGGHGSVEPPEGAAQDYRERARNRKAKSEESGSDPLSDPEPSE